MILARKLTITRFPIRSLPPPPLPRGQILFYNTAINKFPFPSKSCFDIDLFEFISGIKHLQNHAISNSNPKYKLCQGVSSGFGGGGGVGFPYFYKVQNINHYLKIFENFFLYTLREGVNKKIAFRGHAAGWDPNQRIILSKYYIKVHMSIMKS